MLGGPCPGAATLPSGAWVVRRPATDDLCGVRELAHLGACPWPLPGDANGDCVVDLVDYGLVQRDLDEGGPGAPLPPAPNGDVDRNGTVDLADYNAVVANLGQTCLTYEL
jgi:hypothetical protein